MVLHSWTCRFVRQCLMLLWLLLPWSMMPSLLLLNSYMEWKSIGRHGSLFVSSVSEDKSKKKKKKQQTTVSFNYDKCVMKLLQLSHISWLVLIYCPIMFKTPFWVTFTHDSRLNTNFPIILELDPACTCRTSSLDWSYPMCSLVLEAWAASPLELVPVLVI